MKKILSLVLAMLMIFSVVPAVFAADTKAENAHQEAVDFLKTIGLYAPGAGNNDSDKLERWHMALFVSRLVTGKLATEDAYWKTTENDSGFEDVAKFLKTGEEYIVGAISFAAQQGIINGYGDGKFGPHDGITYRDALVMVVRALGTTYGAAGYPWSYVKTAGDWGLTKGLENVGHMDQLTRAQIAQVLYNALFVEIDGKTVAEKVFGVGTETVIITASNKVKLNEKDAVVVRENFVQFAVADAEGVPSGTKYHVAAADLGITDANAAVGTAYEVTYQNNFAKILKSVSLNTTYTNYAGKDQIAIDAKNKTITLDGVKTTMVDKYTALNNLQGTDNKTGMLESKVYADAAAAGMNLGTMGNDYYMDEQGYIYKIADLSLVAYYSVFFDTLYGASVDNHGVVTFTAAPANKAAIIADLTMGAGQFTLTTGATDTAYAKAVASDLDGDDVYDRVLLRNYTFGTITVSSDAKTLTLKKGALTNDLTANGSVTVANYRFSGVAASELAKSKTYYALYYVDTKNAEIDILEVIGTAGEANKAEGKTNYVAKGYLLGFHQTNNLVYFNDGVDKITTLTVGYDDMLGTPLKAFIANPGTDAAKIKHNEDMIAEFLTFQNKYVEYVVVNDKLVYIADEVKATSDVVVIDYFTSISEDGIEAYAWSTKTNSYDIIKIAEFNGWNVGGFDWKDYYFNSIFPGFNSTLGGTTNLESLLPVKRGEIYKVIYVRNDNEYNLTDANKTSSIVEVANGYIHTIADDGKVTKVAETTANDYWVIREMNATTGAVDKIYTRTGAMAKVKLGSATDKVDIYKMANNDYVISGTAAALDDLNGAVFTKGDVKFMYYKRLAGIYDQDHMLDGMGYYYGHWMYDLLTNEPEFVKYETAKWQEIKKAVEEAGDGKIYQVVGGVLTAVNANAPKTVYDAAIYSIEAGEFKGLSVAAPRFDSFDAATVVAKVRDLVEAELGYVYADKAEYILAKNVTVIGIVGETYNKIAGDKTADLNAAFGALSDVTAYTIYKADGSIVVLLKATQLEQAATTVDARAASIGQDYLKKHTYKNAANNNETCTAVDSTLTGFTSMDTLAAEWDSVSTIAEATAHVHAPLTTAAQQKYAHLTNPANVTYLYDDVAKTLKLTINYNLDRWINGMKFTKMDGTTVVAYDNTIPCGQAKNDGVDGTLWGATRNTKALTFEFSGVTALEDMIFWVTSTGTDSCVAVKITIDLTK